jgi:signal recognition particle subunit SRP19
VDTPTVQEMRDVLQSANMVIGIERGFYSRETSKEPQYYGRVRVQLKNDDGSLLSSDFPSSELSVFVVIGA